MTRRRTLVAAGWLAGVGSPGAGARARAPAPQKVSRAPVRPTCSYSGHLHPSMPVCRVTATSRTPRGASPPSSVQRSCCKRARQRRRSQPRGLAAAEAKGSHRGQGHRRYSGRGPAAAAHRPHVPGTASLRRRARADAADGMARPAIEGHGGLRQHPVDSHRIPSISIV